MESAKRVLVVDIGVVATARRTVGRLVIGYIPAPPHVLDPLRQRFADTSVIPTVFRMNQSQQSFGPQWEVAAR